MLCPACNAGHGETIRKHSARAAAEHFVPRGRDVARHERLVTHLTDVLWKQDVVEVQRCPVCGFCFAVPWVGGDAEFYAITHEGDPHYPNHRWEFSVTLDALAGLRPPLRLAEVGAGKGAFLRRLNSGYEITAADFDEGAVRRLRARGIDAVQGSLSDLAQRGDRPNDVICMFQTLEHMADLDKVFELVRTLLKPSGSVFLSVPNADGVEVQEEMTGLWDMPPNHVGRWTPAAIARLAQRQGFAVADIRLEPVRTMTVASLFAVYTVNARSYGPSLERRINGLAARPLRGTLKRIVALPHLPALVSKRHQYRPMSCWAHLIEQT